MATLEVESRAVKKRLDSTTRSNTGECTDMTGLVGISCRYQRNVVDERHIRYYRVVGNYG